MEVGETIVESTGNLLEADVDALVNTVNTVGVMGKGIALQFKRAYPGMFRDYARRARRGELDLGRMHVWPTGLLAGPRFIVNFPTKGHWRASSKLHDIETGLADLVAVIRREAITSIAIPPLGCGNGGLTWSTVQPLIAEALSEVPEVRALVFPPVGAPAAATMPTSGRRPRMTPGRAALVELIARYRVHAFEAPSLIEIQKLMYFLQEAGEPLRLSYRADRYGPYADNLRHVLKDIEGHLLVGFGDGSSRVRDAEPIELIGGSREAAREFVATHPATDSRLQQTLGLIEGFESAYGLELLATVHWVARHGSAQSDDDVVGAVHSWSKRKARIFASDHILEALSALREHGWVKEAAAPA